MLNSVIDLSRCSDKQLRFLRSKCRFTAYGGARGGGKSWALRTKLKLLGMNYNGIRMLLLRRSYAELRENHINVLMSELLGIATYKESEKVFKFKNGSTLKMGYCDSESDVLQYQGIEYDVICMDEATQFTEFQFQTLTASLRGANDFPKRFYLTCNPGGVGHEWVKRLFIEREYRHDENPEEYEFISATVFDNKVLMEKDPHYVNMLNNLDDKLRQAWRDGSWDMLAGQFFNEFNREVHICEPFPIPEEWRRYRVIDYGLDCLACLWVAVNSLNECYVYKEYAESDKVISDGASDILRMTLEDVKLTYAPPDLWSRSQESGKCRADLFHNAGLSLIKSTNDRVAGWMCIKEMLKPNASGDVKLHIFSTCNRLIKCITSIQHDEKNPNDCATQPHDITHLPDALRYFAIMHYRPNPQKKQKEVVNFHFEEKPKHRIIGQDFTRILRR